MKGERKMKHKKVVRPYSVCLASLAAGIAVLLAGSVFLRAGYPADAVVLQVQTGDTSQLQGFTLQGAWQQTIKSGISFSLENGSLTTVPQLQAEPDSGIALWGQGRLCVPEENLAEVDAQATGGAFSGSYGAFFLRSHYEGMNFTAETTHLEEIYTLTVTDGSDLSVRFSLGEIETSAPVTVTAEIHTENRVWGSFPYCTALDGVADTVSGIREVQILSAEEPISLYVGPGNGQNAGIWQVRQLCTPEEIEQIVPDVMIHGTAVPSNTEPYGAVEEVCTLDAGERLAPCADWYNARLDNGRWFLTENGEGELSLLLLDENWQILSEQPLGMKMTEGQQVTVLPSMRTNEIVFTVTDSNGAGQASVLRMENGKVQAQKVMTVTAETPLLTAGFSQDGTKLMIVSEKAEDLTVLVPAALREQYAYTPMAESEVPYTADAVTEWNVQVYPVDDLSGPSFSAVLDFGVTQQWAREIWLSGVYNVERNIYRFEVIGAWENAKGEHV